MSEELEKLRSEDKFEKRLWLVHFVRVEDGGVEMREESNRVSCSSRDGNGQERWRRWLLFCGLWSYEYYGRHVCGVTATRELGDLLAEGERSQR